MNDIKPLRVLFVCMGNICRSPTAQGVFQALVDLHGLENAIHVDSAGTHSYHIGSPPDPRSQSAAQSHGINLSGLRARRLASSDFLEFDYLLAMDQSNLADMQAIRPENAVARVELMTAYSESLPQADIPDPYFGEQGFELVFGMIDTAARGLLDEIRSRHGL